MSAYHFEETPQGTEKIDLGSWLKESELSQYHRLFIYKGFETFEDVYQEFKSMDSNEMGLALNAIGIKNYKDKKKFIVAFLRIKQRRKEQDGNPTEFKLSKFHVSSKSDKI
eukprot:483066_1